MPESIPLTSNVMLLISMSYFWLVPRISRMCPAVADFFLRIVLSIPSPCKTVKVPAVKVPAIKYVAAGKKTLTFPVAA